MAKQNKTKSKTAKNKRSNKTSKPTRSKKSSKTTTRTKPKKVTRNKKTLKSQNISKPKKSKTTQKISKPIKTQKSHYVYHDQKLKKVYKLSSLLAILSAILIIPVFFFNTLASRGETLFTLIFISLIIITVLLTLFIFKGYYKFSIKNNLRFLKILVILFVSFAVLAGIYSIFSLFIQNIFFQVTLARVLLVLYNVVSIFFGIALLKKQKNSADLLKLLGLFYILLGVINLVMLLIKIPILFSLIFMLIPAFSVSIRIIEAVFFHKLVRDKDY